MCQILSINNVSKIKNFEKLVGVVKSELVKQNRDGFGFAASNGTETSVFKTVDYGIEYEPQQYEKISAVIDSSNFAYSGSHDTSKFKSAIFHGRVSTNKSGLKNAHPIALNGQCIVHNGVVDVQSDYTQTIDTDTELLTTIQDNLKLNLENKVTGYYAFFNLLSDSKIQVVKDDVATLFLTFITAIDSYMISTDAELISSVCSEMSWEHSSMHTVSSNIIFTIDSANNFTDIDSFRPLGFKHEQAVLSEKSLGRSLQLVDDNLNNFYSDNDNLNNFYSRDDRTYIEELVLQEFEQADQSWSFWHKNKLISLLQFQALTDREKLLCDVMDWEGIEVSVFTVSRELDKISSYK